MISICVYRGEKDWDRYRIAGLKVVEPPRPVHRHVSRRRRLGGIR
jgi:hypothetical protein